MTTEEFITDLINRLNLEHKDQIEKDKQEINERYKKLAKEWSNKYAN